MHARFSQLSIGGKLRAINLLMVTSVAILSMLFLSVFLYQAQLEDHQRNTENLVRALAESLNSTLLFDDAKTATITLKGLSQTQDIRYANLYKPDGRLFASHRRTGVDPSLLKVGLQGAQRGSPFFNDFDEVVFKMMDPADNATLIGTLVVNQSLERAHSQLWRQLAVLLMTSLGGFVLLTLLLNRLQTTITRPLLALSDTMHRVRKDGDLNGRAQYSSDDEIGQLGQSFNHLMTELQQRDEERNVATVRLSAVLQAVPDLMFEVDGDGVYLNVWGVRSDLLAAPSSELLGRRVSDVLPLAAAEEVICGIREADAAASGYSFGRQIILTVPAGADHCFELSVARHQGLPGRAATYIVLSRDITERRNAEEEIRQLAFYDALTQLPNRRLLMDRLQTAMAFSARTRFFGALLFLDMDRFKTINDTLGHDHGDLMLIEVARRIQSCLRDADTVARLGGDEFVVILYELDGSADVAARRAAQVAEKIRIALAAPYQLNDHERYSSPSIGVCMYLGNEVAADELLKCADVAMYKAKDDGRNLVRFFGHAMQLAVEIRASLDLELRQCVQEQQLCLFYQLQVDQNGVAVGAEALVRWVHPVRGLVPPAHFIGIAEESHLIIDIGNWVLDTACEQLKTWSARPSTEGLTIAVNVSAHQFKQPQFVDLVTTIALRHGIEPSRLKLELTESVIMEDVDGVIAKMHILKKLGFALSLDDFGTGYSSLSYLKLLPISQIKIDRSFVTDIESEPNDAVMVRSIIDLAKNFNLAVIAEGVETPAQLDFLVRNGCREFQGYYFGKPVPIEAFELQLAQLEAEPTEIQVQVPSGDASVCLP